MTTANEDPVAAIEGADAVVRAVVEGHLDVGVAHAGVAPVVYGEP